MVALSVSISASTSPAANASPSCTSQRPMVPSSIVSESRGITSSSDMDPSSGGSRDPALGQQAARGGLDLALERQRRELERLGVGHGHLSAANALDRGVEVVEAEAVDAGGQLGADSVGRPALLGDQRTAGLAHGLGHG